MARIAGVDPDRAQGPKKAVFEAQTSELFSRVLGFFDEDALVELTAAIAWENLLEQVQPGPARTVPGSVETHTVTPPSSRWGRPHISHGRRQPRCGLW